MGSLCKSVSQWYSGFRFPKLGKKLICQKQGVAIREENTIYLCTFYKYGWVPVVLRFDAIVPLDPQRIKGFVGTTLTLSTRSLLQL